MKAEIKFQIKTADRNSYCYPFTNYPVCTNRKLAETIISTAPEDIRKDLFVHKITNFICETEQDIANLEMYKRAYKYISEDRKFGEIPESIKNFISSVIDIESEQNEIN